MNNTIDVGVINTLKINRLSQVGLYLISGKEEEVLLPNVYVKEHMKIGETIEVFIYTDSEDRIVATTLKPKAMLDDIAFLKVVDTAKFGAFVDIGLPKDILVPKNKQKKPFSIGEKRLVKIIKDEKSNRLIAVEKFKEIFDKKSNNLKVKDEVEIVIDKKTPLGFKVYVNKKYEGMIYHTEIFTQLNIGDEKKAYIKHIRDDGKLDIVLQKIGVKKSNDDVLKIIEILKDNNNSLPITSKSDANDIKSFFQMSKKRFKAALNSLIMNNEVLLEKDTIRLV